MLEAVKKLSAKVKAIDQGKELNQILTNESMQAQIIDLNQRQIYEQGIQADGTPTGEYSPKTIALKIQHGDARGVPGRVDHITGLDTGITYDSMNVKAEPDGIVINAEDRNGFFEIEPKGLGLTKESINEIIPEVRQSLIQRLRRLIAA